MSLSFTFQYFFFFWGNVENIEHSNKFIGSSNDFVYSLFFSCKFLCKHILYEAHYSILSKLLNPFWNDGGLSELLSVCLHTNSLYFRYTCQCWYISAWIWCFFYMCMCVWVCLNSNLGVKFFNNSRSSSSSMKKIHKGGELFACDDDNDDEYEFIEKETVLKMLKQRNKLISQQNLPFVHRITTHAVTTLEFIPYSSIF